MNRILYNLGINRISGLYAFPIIARYFRLLRFSPKSFCFPYHIVKHAPTPSLSPYINTLAGISLVLYKTKLIFFFRFLEKMSALADLINLDLSDSTEKIIAEYIWSVQFIHLYQIIFSLY